MTAGAAPRILVVDHHDSFVFTLVSYLRELGAEVDVVEGDELGTEALLARAEDADGVLVSPGPGRPEDVPASTALVRLAEATGRPLLGVCLGHQVLAHALGARVTEAPELLHGRTSAVLHDGDPLFDGLPSGFAAMRYHSLAVDGESIPEELRVTARTPEGVVMAVRHRSAPLVGVQFHPESVLTEGGRRLLENWLRDVESVGPSRPAGDTPGIPIRVR
ncbi:aminodeoxychorismate/anthranilate synthase component II [Rathayibacter sp. VKM Ac-2801]|uniref:anthranilate synthase component II n=1 Tax=Rathayibacter sp. VKM Ac-2801 TaxID=2609255 RepID=UPI00131F583C|nr:aminodeoxychorismate/anthranilate synthase component II [Rathayibacter sp. VKM Ac-2801]QHC68940.1 aminodeoxychorismate/anthranilate synthase component II [Rathayibacter sp. VKM Ac-2801]